MKIFKKIEKPDPKRIAELERKLGFSDSVPVKSKELLTVVHDVCLYGITPVYGTMSELPLKAGYKNGILCDNCIDDNSVTDAKFVPEYGIGSEEPIGYIEYGVGLHRPSYTRIITSEPKRNKVNRIIY